MKRRLATLLSFVSVVLVSLPAAAQTAAETPSWGRGLQGWGVAEVPRAPGKRDLEQVPKTRSVLVTQDARDILYLLDAASGRVDEYAPNGDKRGSWSVQRWEPLEASTSLSDLATDRRGNVFAFASRGKIRVFEREELISTFAVPTFVTGLAFMKGELMVARLPLQFGRFEGVREPFVRKPALLSRLSLKGETLGEALAPDKAEAPDQFSLAMTQDVAIAADEGRGVAWVADRHRLYRLRRLSPSGQVTGEWVSDTVKARVKFEGTVPEEATQHVTEEAARGFRPVDAPMVVRDLVARNGFTYVLLNPGAVADMAFVDVFSGTDEGPMWRIALQVEGGRYFDQLAVTENGFWLFPVAPGELPRWVERAPDWLMMQSAKTTGKEGEGASSSSR